MTASDDSTIDPKYLPLWQLLKVRLLEFCREPAAIFWVYVFPILMMIALGIAFRNRPVERATVWVQTGGAAAHVVFELNKDARFRTVIGDQHECRRRLRIGQADLVLVAESERHYDYYYDPTRPGSLLARSAVDDVLQRVAGRQDVASSADHEVSEPGGRYIDFLIPGLIGMGLLGGGLWGVGFAIVDLRIRKLLKRYLATPMSKSQFLASIMLSRLAFTIPEVVVLLLVARLLFAVKCHGSYLNLGILILLGSCEFAGIGLLVACRAKTLETVSGLMNLVMLPMWIGSGIFFPADRFPDFVQPVIRLLPLTPLIDSLRSVMLEGTGLVALGPQLGVICVWTVVTFLLALRWFRWR